MIKRQKRKLYPDPKDIVPYYEVSEAMQRAWVEALVACLEDEQTRIAEITRDVSNQRFD